MSYASERDFIRAEFEDGMDELFRTMFTESVLLYMLDEEATVTNVYQETEKKVYLAPYSLTAKLELIREKGEEDVQTILQGAKITVPNRQLKEYGIPHETDEALKLLQKCAIKYKEFVFLVDKVTPRVHVADTYLFYDFSCATRDKDNRTDFVLPPPNEEVP